MGTTPYKKETNVAIANPGGDERGRRAGCGGPTRCDANRTLRSGDTVHSGHPVRRALSGTAEHSAGGA